MSSREKASDVSAIRRWLWSLGLAGAVLLLTLLVVGFWNWGRGQLYGPDFVVRKARKGMQLDRIAYDLGFHPEALGNRFSEGGKVVVSLSEPGVGSYFVPQHETSLHFDEGGSLAAATAKWTYRLDESEERIPLR